MTDSTCHDGAGAGAAVDNGASVSVDGAVDDGRAVDPGETAAEGVDSIAIQKVKIVRVTAVKKIEYMW